MAKCAYILSILLVISFACFSLADSQQLQTRFENSTEIIPRDVIFGNPERISVLISPDGKWISYLTALSGVFNVQIAPVDNITESRSITNETIRGVESYFWAYTNHSIVYRQDTFGDENWHIYAVNITTGVKIDLTPYKNVSAQIDGVSNKFTQEILIGLNDRNTEYHDLYRVNITTGERRLVLKNDNRFAGFVIDDDLKVRLAANVTSSGDVDYLKPAGNGSWEPFMKINYEDSVTTYPIGFDKTGDILYMSESRGRNTAAIESINLATNESKVLAEDPKADAGMIMVHPTEMTIQAVDFNYYRHNWRVMDETIKPDIDYLCKIAAALAGMTFTPKIFACGVEYCGPSNLTSFLLTIPPYWKPDIEMKFKRIGDYRTEDGRILLRERSPLLYVDRIQRPIFIAQGANDPRVNKNESSQIVQAMQEKKIPVTYALYPDEGHGFVRPGNGMAFYAITEAFFSMHLGGRYEPIGSDLNGSSITIPVGADHVPDLVEALAHKTS